MSKWIAEFELEDGDTMPEHMDLEYKGAKIDFHCRPMWIPCSERLPEDEYVLISKKPSKISGDKWCVAIAIRTADQRSRKVQWRDTGFGVIPDDNVLAWMPFPEPYQGRGEEHETD